MATERTFMLPIEGMSCQHCVQRVQDALEGVPGVNRADVDLDAGRATVGAGEDVAREKLVVAVADAGYEASSEA